MQYKVLITDNVDQGCDEILAGQGLEVVRALGKSEDELAELVGDFDAMVVRSAVKVRRPLIEKMSRMKVIGRAGAGVDNIDVEAATEKGILVMNTPGGNTISVAEHTVAMLLSLCRKIPAANRSLQNEEWNRKAFVGTELLGKTVGVLGLGRIGREVVKRLQGFDVTLIGYDPMLSLEAIKAMGIEPVDFESLVSRSDILSLHLPLNDETRDMIGEDEFSRLKEGAFIVNCARGGIVDEKALLAALDRGQIKGAAFDVFINEPVLFPNELINHAHVVATPHIAASTSEAQKRVALAVARQIASLLNGGEVVGLVNAGGLGDALQHEFTPFAKAAISLGRVVRELLGSENLTIWGEVFGENTSHMIEGLEASLFVGLLEGKAPVVNTVNAGMMAKNRGIESRFSGEGPHKSYHFLLQATVQHGDNDNIVRAGVTLFGSGEPRLVMLNDHWLDIRPEGPMLLVDHDDRPGTLAGISTILGEAQINIADLSLGRAEQGNGAMTLIRVDTPADPSTLQRVSSVENVRRVQALQLNHKSLPTSETIA